MDIQKLAAFTSLAETLSYSKTAEERFTTQGNITKQIQALERELGLRLFNRSSRKISLTTAGKNLLLGAQTIVAQWELLQEQALELQRENRHRLVIQTIPTINKYHALKLLNAFSRQYPEIDWRLQEMENPQIGQLDNLSEDVIYFARLFDLNQKAFDYRLVEPDRLMVLLPRDHPRAKDKVVHLEQLKEESFLLLSSETGSRQPIIDLCRKAGFIPRDNYGGSRIDMILELVTSHMGISLLMEKTVVNQLSPELVLRPITPGLESYLCFLRTKGSHSVASNCFWNSLK